MSQSVSNFSFTAQLNAQCILNAQGFKEKLGLKYPFRRFALREDLTRSSSVVRISGPQPEDPGSIPGFSIIFSAICFLFGIFTYLLQKMLNELLLLFCVS